MHRRRLDTSRAAHKGGSSLPNQEVITGEAESLLLEAEADNTLSVQGEISDLCVSVALKTNSKSTRKKKRDSGRVVFAFISASMSFEVNVCQMSEYFFVNI